MILLPTSDIIRHTIICSDSTVLANDDGGLTAGDYFVAGKYNSISARKLLTCFSLGYHYITKTEFIPRTTSMPGSSGREKQFREAVRKRDGGCWGSGIMNPNISRDIWTGFEAAYILPLAHDGTPLAAKFQNMITIPTGDNWVNSVQNGILLLSVVHKEFDNYEWSINPDV